MCSWMVAFAPGLRRGRRAGTGLHRPRRFEGRDLRALRAEGLHIGQELDQVILAHLPLERGHDRWDGETLHDLRLRVENRLTDVVVIGSDEGVVAEHGVGAIEPDERRAAPGRVASVTGAAGVPLNGRLARAA